MAFPAKYDGTCSNCGGSFAAGDLIKGAGRAGRKRYWAHASQVDCQAEAEAASEARFFAGVSAFESGAYAEPDFDLAEATRERRRMDAEYALGMSQAEDVRWARMIGGEAAAIEMEIHHDNLAGY